MTTVVYKNGVMASDTQCTVNNRMYTNVHYKKIHKTEGGLLGMAGGADQHWLLNEETHVIATMSDFRDFLVNLTGTGNTGQYVFVKTGSPNEVLMGEVYVSEGEHDFAIFSLELDDSGVAIGSGTDSALAAMSTGCDAIDAVKIASLHDIYTNDVVDAVFLNG